MTGAVDVGRSFVRLIVPFTFDPTQFDAMAARADACEWRLRDRHHPVWTQMSLQYEDLIPSVAGFWNNADDRPPAGRFWCVHDQVLRSPAGLAARTRGRSPAAAATPASTRWRWSWPRSVRAPDR